MSEPRQDVHLWQPHNQDDCWTSQRVDPHAIPQVAQIEKDSSPSPIPQLAIWDEDIDLDTENQLDYWDVPELFDPVPPQTGVLSGGAAPQTPASTAAPLIDAPPDVPVIRLVQAWRYRQNEQGLAQGAPA